MFLFPLSLAQLSGGLNLFWEVVWVLGALSFCSNETSLRGLRSATSNYFQELPDVTNRGKRGEPSSMLWAVYPFKLHHYQDYSGLIILWEMNRRHESLFCSQRRKWRCQRTWERRQQIFWFAWSGVCTSSPDSQKVTQVLGINGSSDCCPDSTRISKIKAGTHRRAKSLGTWLLVGELAYLGHYLCGLDVRTSMSTGARRDT